MLRLLPIRKIPRPPTIGPGPARFWIEMSELPLTLLEFGTLWWQYSNGAKHESVNSKCDYFHHFYMFRTIGVLPPWGPGVHED